MAAALRGFLQRRRSILVTVLHLILLNQQMNGDVSAFALCYHQACHSLDQIGLNLERAIKQNGMPPPP